MDMFHFDKEDMFEDIDGIIRVGDFIKKPKAYERICYLFRCSYHVYVFNVLMCFSIYANQRESTLTIARQRFVD
jgi:hypothetical protein